jgi:glutathione synthase
MTYKIAIQMDPLEKINFATDSTFLLMKEATKRGYLLYHYQPEHLNLFNGNVFANVAQLSITGEQQYELTSRTLLPLEEFDIIMLRQDPPFDISYITSTYLLEKVQGKTLVINNPQEVRNSPEKLLVTDFQECTPPTLISSDKEQIISFWQQHRNIVLKPLHAFGGMDIFRIRENEINFDSILDLMLRQYSKQPLIAQLYLEEVLAGDKRIILLDGEPIGALLRKPSAGKIISNLAAGGTAHATGITSQDQKICRKLAPVLKEKELLLVGIDIIGSYLTEINVTSPTGLVAINKLNNCKLEETIWDKIISKYQGI